MDTRPQRMLAATVAALESACRRRRPLPVAHLYILLLAHAGRAAVHLGRRTGAEQESIDSQVLCRALFGVYLDQEPISVEGRKTVIAGFPGAVGATVPLICGTGGLPLPRAAP